MTRQNDSHIEHDRLRNPWLVAIWPGMGQVASAAGAYLIETLQPEPVASIPEREFYNLDSVEVSGGIARAGRLPRNMFLAWRDPRGQRDLLIFFAEGQPARHSDRLARRIIDVALEHGAERVVTFGAMGTGMEPTAPSHVLGAANQPDLLHSMRSAGIAPLAEGRIGGLNGTLLIAAAERDVPAVCLLGQMPAFASALPNPKASLAALEAFCAMADIDVDLDRLREIAKASESKLTQIYEQLKTQLAEMEPGARIEGDGQTIFEGMEPQDNEEASDKPTEPDALDLDTRRRIEALFDAAERDRSSAGELKAELDRLGIFDEYENRFLDLFRKAG